MAVYNNETGFYARDSQVPFIEGGFPPRVERHCMNRTRFLTNYCIVPGFMVLCGLLIAVAMILVNIVYTVIDFFLKSDNTVMEKISAEVGKLNYGFSSAMAWVYFLCVVVALGIVSLIISRRVYYYE